MRSRRTHRRLVGAVVALGLCLLSTPLAADEYDGDPAVQEAAPLLRAADEIYAKVERLDAKGLGLEARAAREEAFPAYETCLERLRLLLGDADHPWKYRCLSRLGQCTQGSVNGLGGPHRALGYFEQSLAMRGRLHPGPTQEVLDGLLDVALCHHSRGFSYRAIPFLEDAFDVAEALHPGDHPEKANVLGMLATIVEQAGRPRDAVPLQRRTVAMLQRMGMAETRDYGWALNNLIWTLATAGMSDEAVSRIAELRALWPRIVPGGDLNVSTSLDNIAYALRALGRFPEAIAVYEESLAMRRRLTGQRGGWVVPSLVNLGYCYVALGRVEDALRVYREAYDINQELDPDTRDPLGQTRIGNALAQLGRHDEALPLFEAALREVRANIAEDKIGADNYGHAFPMLGLARSLGALERWEEAEPHIRAAHEMFEQTYPDGHGYTVRSHSMLGRCLEMLGRLDEAQVHYEAALGMARELSLDARHQEAGRLAWFLLERRGRPEAAVPLFEEAVEQIELLRQLSAGMLQTDVASYFASLKSGGAYEGLLRARLLAGDAEGALDTLDRGRARGLLDLLARSRVDALDLVARQATSAGDDATATRARELTEHIDASAREVRFRFGRRNKLRREPGVSLQDKQAAHRAWLSAVQAQDELLRERALLVGHHVPVASPAGVASIRGVLGPREALLCYTVSPHDGWVLLVPPPGSEVRAFPLTEDGSTPCNAATLGSMVDALRDALLGEDEGDAPADTVGRLGHRLFGALVPNELWKAVLDLDRVYVVPHGPLHAIPFEALVVHAGRDESSHRYWLDEGPPIAYAPAASVFVWSARRRTAQASGRPSDGVEVVALGDPIFDRGTPPAPPMRGALITEVRPAPGVLPPGLCVGDVVLGVDGRPIDRPVALRRFLDEDAPERASLRVWRLGAEIDIEVHPPTLAVVVAQEDVQAAWARLCGGESRHRGARKERDALLRRYGGRLDSLPATRQEVLAIRSIVEGAGETPLRRVVTLLDEQATKGHLDAVANKARFLHLATHHLVDESAGGSYSRMALTVPPVVTAADDGFLTLTDLLEGWRDRLQHCELVVLSGCETNRGPQQRDEGVLAMPWGFFHAGAPAVVASLWLVADVTTATLMTEFYRGLAKDVDHLTALHEARKAVRASHPSPYHWAPFVYLGAPR